MTNLAEAVATGFSTVGMLSPLLSRAPIANRNTSVLKRLPNCRLTIQNQLSNGGWRGASTVLGAALDIEACLQSAPLSLDPSAASIVAQKVQDINPKVCNENLALLLELYKPRHAGLLVQLEPRVLSLPLNDWYQFLHGFGVNERQFWEAIRFHAAIFAATDCYTAGRTILFLKQLGPWQDVDVASRLLPCYPQLLATPEPHLHYVLQQLEQEIQLEPGQAAALIWEFPGILGEEFAWEHLPLLRRIRESSDRKYKQTAAYHV